MDGGLLFDSPANRRDVFHKSSCDDGVFELAKLLGWEVRLEKKNSFYHEFLFVQDDFKKLLETERKPKQTEVEDAETSAENLAKLLSNTKLDAETKDKVEESSDKKPKIEEP